MENNISNRLYMIKWKKNKLRKNCKVVTKIQIKIQLKSKMNPNSLNVYNHRFQNIFLLTYLTGNPSKIIESLGQQTYQPRSSARLTLGLHCLL